MPAPVTAANTNAATVTSIVTINARSNSGPSVKSALEMASGPGSTKGCTS